MGMLKYFWHSAICSYLLGNIKRPVAYDPIRDISIGAVLKLYQSDLFCRVISIDHSNYELEVQKVLTTINPNDDIHITNDPDDIIADLLL